MNRSLEAMRARYGPRYRWLVLMTVMVGTIASIMSSTIVNVAVPRLMDHFAVGQERAQWVAGGFMTAMTLSMVTTPWLLARFGYRLTYVGAVTLLMLGGIGGGLAQTYDQVLAMRALEGVAAGILQPIPQIIILRAFARGEQGRAMGVFGFGAVLAPALGPTIGGVLVDHFGWRSIFYVVVPFAAVSILLARCYLPHSAPGGLQPGSSGARLDLIGLALAAAALIGLQNGLVRLHDLPPTPGMLLLALSATAVALFILRARVARDPLIDLRIFDSRSLRMGSVVAFVYGMGLFGSTYLVPVFMQSALAFSATEAGATLLPAGIALALAMPIAGRLADRLPPHRLVTTGLALLAASFLLMSGMGPGGALAMLVLWAIVGRLGLALIMPALTLGALRDLPAGCLSQGASAINVFRQLGGATGISAVAIFLEWRLRVHGQVPDAPIAYAETFWLVAGIAAAAMLAASRMKRRATSAATTPPPEA